MRRIFRFLALVLVCVLPCIGGAQAQEEPSAALLVPTSGWLVGPASLAEGLGAAMPCVMLNQYNNGYNLRFSGGNGHILAMAIDFRQDAFRAGSTYELEVAVPPDFSQKVTATALNSGTIVINTQKYDGLYAALSKGKSLRLSVKDSDLNFLLAGASDGLERIEHCRNPSAQAALESGSALPSNRSGAVATGRTEAARVTVTAGQNEVRDPIDAMLGSAEEKLSVIQPSAGMAAAHGQEKEKSIKAQVQPSEEGAEQGSVSQAPPLGKPLAGSWLPPLTPRKVGMSQRDVIVASAAQKAEKGQITDQPGRRWRAIKGTDLHEILDVWARNAGVRMLWQASRDYAVKDTIGMQGGFEDAVLAVLEQFDDETYRPVGKIFIDPVEGQKVLIIETSVKKGVF